ncbi:unnamed protein product [Prorocentrum cordatum]|uniref:Uncharacterized protein n=1 Tax=Prorocentrum cordatum TaxID=2364126 RepID=A0ABN9TRC6_9DINO|nr:unnamed protein product [Polarella glacialis]
MICAPPSWTPPLLDAPEGGPPRRCRALGRPDGAALFPSLGSSHATLLHSRRSSRTTRATRCRSSGHAKLVALHAMMIRRRQKLWPPREAGGAARHREPSCVEGGARCRRGPAGPPRAVPRRRGCSGRPPRQEPPPRGGPDESSGGASWLASAAHQRMF